MLAGEVDARDDVRRRPRPWRSRRGGGRSSRCTRPAPSRMPGRRASSADPAAGPPGRRRGRRRGGPGDGVGHRPSSGETSNGGTLGSRAFANRSADQRSARSCSDALCQCVRALLPGELDGPPAAWRCPARSGRGPRSSGAPRAATTCPPAPGRTPPPRRAPPLRPRSSPCGRARRPRGRARTVCAPGTLARRAGRSRRGCGAPRQRPAGPTR